MLNFSRNWPAPALLLRGTALLALAVALTGCVAQVRVAGPPVGVRGTRRYVDVQAREAPPPLPDYEQPPCPEDGYLWTPGYWAWGGGGYYWVPGTWVQPPRVGRAVDARLLGLRGRRLRVPCRLLGTPRRLLRRGQLRLRLCGHGFAGGAWVGGAFSYNRAVTNMNVTVVHNTYNTTVINNVMVNKVSYNGGAGGTSVAPTAQERQFSQEPHAPPTPLQRQHVQQAQANPALFAHANGGHPSIAATPRPAAFNAPGVVGARGAGGPPARAQPQPAQAQPQQRVQPEAQNQPQSGNQRAAVNPQQARQQNQRQQQPQNQQKKKKNQNKPKPKPKKEDRKKDE